MPVIQLSGGLRPKHPEFEPSPGNSMRPCLSKKKKLALKKKKKKRGGDVQKGLGSLPRDGVGGLVLNGLPANRETFFQRGRLGAGMRGSA